VFARGCGAIIAQYMDWRFSPTARPISARLDPLFRTAAIMSARCHPSPVPVDTTSLQPARLQFFGSANHPWLVYSRKLERQSSLVNQFLQKFGILAGGYAD
jgi:hypothetical protein